MLVHYRSRNVFASIAVLGGAFDVLIFEAWRSAETASKARVALMGSVEGVCS